MRRKTKITFADSISVVDCEGCGEVHIRLHDENGNVFAEATLPDEALLELTGDLMDICDDIFDGDGQDTIGETIGTA